MRDCLVSFSAWMALAVVHKLDSGHAILLLKSLLYKINANDQRYCCESSDHRDRKPLERSLSSSSSFLLYFDHHPDGCSKN